MKTQFSRKEKRLLVFTTTLSLGFLALNGIYQWNNRVPDVVIPETPMPKDNALHYYQRAVKLYVQPPATGPAVDWHLDNSRPARVTEMYSKEYDRFYPLARKQAFLKRNAKAIAIWREGLKRRYVQPPEREAKTVVELGPFRMLARDLIAIEARAKAQGGDWDGAADSSLDIIHFGYEVPRGGPLRIGLVGIAIRKIGLHEMWPILPYLSVAKKRELIRKLEALRPTRVTIVETMEEEKRSMQRFILKMTRERDFRLLFVEPSCCGFDSPTPTKAEFEEMLNSVDKPLQVYAAWMNKAHIFGEYSRCMDWQINQLKKPYPLYDKNWPFPTDEHAYKIDLVWFKYPQFMRTRMKDALMETEEALLTTMLALDVYRAEHGKYPQNLSELVPKYLQRVPIDPYSNNQPLRYKPKSIRYLSSLRYKEEPKPVVIAPGQVPGGPPPGAPPEVGAEYIAPPPPEYVKTHRTVPYTLYSIGADSRDDGGKPYQDEKYKNDTNASADRARYKLRNYFDDEKCDIVAGINW